MLVEFLIDCADHDLQIDAGVNVLLQALQALRSGQDVDGGHILGTALGQVVGGGDQGTAGGQHRVQEEALERSSGRRLA